MFPALDKRIIFTKRRDPNFKQLQSIPGFKLFPDQKTQITTITQTQPSKSSGVLHAQLTSHVVPERQTNRSNNSKVFSSLLSVSPTETCLYRKDGGFNS